MPRPERASLTRKGRVRREEGTRKLRGFQDQPCSRSDWLPVTCFAEDLSSFLTAAGLLWISLGFIHIQSLQTPEFPLPCPCPYPTLTYHHHLLLEPGVHTSSQPRPLGLHRYKMAAWTPCGPPSPCVHWGQPLPTLTWPLPGLHCCPHACGRSQRDRASQQFNGAEFVSAPVTGFPHLAHVQGAF